MCYSRMIMCFKVCFFILIAMIEVTDLTFDWLFYVEMSKQLAGIVFGPIDETFLYAILAFCCIGVVTFIMEMVYIKLDLFNHESNYCIDVVYLSAIVLWCEELPQIGMSAYIASCREESTSLVQIIKASLLILGCLIRIFIVIKRVYSRRKTDSNKYLFSVISFILIVGSIIALIFAGSVFVFSTIKRDGWSFKFQASTELETSKGDPSRFFGSAGIYINGAELHKGSTQLNLNNTWLKMVNLTSLIDEPSQLHKIKFEREVNTKILIQTFLPRNDSADFKNVKSECYNETSRLLFRKVNESECLTLINITDAEEIWIHFIFLPPTRYLLMGDVQYNACHVTSEDCSDNLKTCTEVNLKYFSAESGENDQYHLKHTPTNSLFEFYTSDNLTPSKEAWKTGFGGCKSSGFESPNWYGSIALNCPK